MPRKIQKLPPLKNDEVRILEAVNNTCMQLIRKIESGEDIELSPAFVHLLCNHNLYLYGRLIDANYVKRPLAPLVPLDIIH